MKISLTLPCPCLFEWNRADHADYVNVNANAGTSRHGKLAFNLLHFDLILEGAVRIIFFKEPEIEKKKCRRQLGISNFRQEAHLQ